MNKKQATKRLAEIKKAIEAENISYGEIAELQTLSDYIDGDIILMEWAGIPENEAITERIDKEYTRLYDKAIETMLYKTDINIREWLSPEEALRYDILDEWLGTTDNLEDIAKTVGTTTKEVRKVLKSVGTL